MYNDELKFESDLVKALQENGWTDGVLKNPTEKDLLDNWAKILFENNRQKDRLSDYPLTDTEIQQILDKINELKYPIKLNSFINGRTIGIIRDNPNDLLHKGKEISLKIYDRQEIAAGQSRYQIAEQPIFNKKSPILNDRRGDIMLLINGMSLFHIELKKSNISIKQATNQIEKYSHEGIYNSGIYQLVQLFIAMTPEESMYFSNPGPDGKFNPSFYFHWEDFNNELINNWKDITRTLLSIPMAHQMIGFYTVADDTDNVLKVMRSYQYYAANKISDVVSKMDWTNPNNRGGYIWHTTGSGKTMTAFKSAQLIANSKDADRVVFLMDRIELGTQSLDEYQNFADNKDDVSGTSNTKDLITQLKDDKNILIVKKKKKMSLIKDIIGNYTHDLELINKKRIVFIIDECHRDTFGTMMSTIKATFPKAVFFGFTGTPVFDENKKQMSVTSDIFGDELHRYVIADGIRDDNVLAFDIKKVLTFRDNDLRRAVALEKCKVNSEDEALLNNEKSKLYYEFMNNMPMASIVGNNGEIIKGIEDYIPNSQYNNSVHREKVVESILENLKSISHNNEFSGILATSSIPEAIEYYRLLKSKCANELFKFTILVDPSIDNNDGAIFKEDGLVEIIDDYNKMYDHQFSLSTAGTLKKDISNRLAHKKPYTNILEKDKLGLLIVVDQMLTGFDSKWLNVLYLDKVLRYESIIQAFSRTNRLFGPEKPFGSIKYYRAPNTMEQNIHAAVKLYSGDKPLGMFAVKLDNNLENMNAVFVEIKNLFEQAGIFNFEKLPAETTEKKKFATLLKDFNAYLEAAKVQGFVWNTLTYSFTDEETGEVHDIELALDEKIYKVLVLRYKELFGGGEEGGSEDSPYDLEGYITTINTDEIDADYMNSRFEKYKKALSSGDPANADSAKEELHKTFATLSQEEQKYANIFLHDMQTGDAHVEPGKTLRDYINEYMKRAKNDQIHCVASAFGLDEEMLRNMMALSVDDASINEFGRFDNLKATIDITKATAYFEKVSGKKSPLPMVNIKVDKILRDFIINGGYDIDLPE